MDKVPFALKFRMLFWITGISIFILPGCKNHTVHVNEVITVSILPQKYFVEKIAGHKFEINVMIPPGASPATYDPLPGQLKNLSQSALYLRIGYIGFEQSWMSKIRDINPNMKIADLSEGVPVIEGHEHSSHSHHGIDPHIWVSVKNAKLMAKNTYKALKQISPSDSAVFEKNLRTFYSELEAFDAKLTDTLKQLSNRHFLIYHPALTYLARDYNLVQLPMEFEGKEPSPSYLKDIVKNARANHVKLIFIQQEFDIKNATVVAREIGGNIVQINPLDEDWKNQLTFIVSSLILANESANEK
ncbi:MAG: zinc ABC transporter substrate-binding protein [Bacteroidales bacterium]|nr:zinc ABC transporter substrate-binding protein [Bacteroidales bacterium]